MANISIIVKSLINDNDAIVFGNWYKPSTDRVMRVYISINAQYRVVELGHDEEGANIKAYPIKFTEQPTLPQIFTKRRHARCCDEITRAMKSSQLQELINGERVQV